MKQKRASITRDRTKNTAIALPMSIKKYLYTKLLIATAQQPQQQNQFGKKNFCSRGNCWENFKSQQDMLFKLMRFIEQECKIFLSVDKDKMGKCVYWIEILLMISIFVIFLLIMTSIRRSLTEYLLRMNTLEVMAEKIREKIAENSYFQIETVFERFDKFKKGYLIPDDFSEFMLQNKIYPTEIELYLIFRDFDKDRVGVITLQKFSQQLLPKENIKLNKKALDRRYYEAYTRLEIDLQYLISRYFDHKIKEIKQLSKIRLQINQKSPMLVEESFSLIDSDKRGVIQNLGQIDSFLRRNGKVVAKDDLVRIFRVLSFDKDGAVLYQTFSEHLDPLGKGYYIGYSQRIEQKHLVQQDYLRKKYEINNEILRNSRERIILQNSIGQLQVSNNRLEDIIRQQRLQEELLWQSRRGYK